MKVLFLNSFINALHGILLPTSILPIYTVLNATFLSRSSMGLSRKNIKLLTMLRTDTNQESVCTSFS